MKSYTEGRNEYGVDTKNSSSTNLSYGDLKANNIYREICSLKDWPFLERVRTLTTTASTQFTNLPYDCSIVRSIAVTPTGQTTKYTPDLAPSRKFWDDLNMTQTTSDIPEYYYVTDGQVGLWPIPASTGNTITVSQKTAVLDLNRADYTAGTIVSITSGSTTVTGSGTSWTNAMVGRYIKITNTDATNQGDGRWYEISSVTSTTVLEIERKYGGNTITAGSAGYIIGQMPLLPEDYQYLPWAYAAGVYWAKEVDERGGVFSSMYETGLSNLIKAYSTSTTGMVIDPGTDDEILNPNLTINL